MSTTFVHVVIHIPLTCCTNWSRLEKKGSLTSTWYSCLTLTFLWLVFVKGEWRCGPFEVKSLFLLSVGCECWVVFLFVQTFSVFPCLGQKYVPKLSEFTVGISELSMQLSWLFAASSNVVRHFFSLDTEFPQIGTAVTKYFSSIVPRF